MKKKSIIQKCFPIYITQRILYFPKPIKLLCLPLEDIFNKYFTIISEKEFQYIEIFNKKDIQINIIIDLQRYLFDIFSIAIDKAIKITNFTYYINLKLYFDTENFNNSSRTIRYKKNDTHKRLDIYLFFIKEIQSLISSYQITDIKKIYEIFIICHK